MGLGVSRGRISHLPIDLRRRPYHTLALPCECVIKERGGRTDRQTDRAAILVGRRKVFLPHQYLTLPFTDQYSEFCKALWAQKYQNDGPNRGVKSLPIYQLRTVQCRHIPQLDGETNIQNVMSIRRRDKDETTSSV